MLPLLWSYLLRSFLRVFFLSVGSFIGILCVTRMKEIARFAALGGGVFSFMRFVLYQIPHILPMAIPVSCFISAVILFQKMSNTEELSTLRASGISLRSVIAPILILAFCLSTLNFFIASEITTLSKQKIRKMLFENTSRNPIELLQRQKLLKISDIFVDMKASPDDQSAKDVLIISDHHLFNGLTVLSFDQVQVKNHSLLAKNFALLTHFENKEGKNSLYIENRGHMTADAKMISELMKESKYRLNPSSLPMRYVMARRHLKHESIHATISEVLRRLVLGMLAFLFTYIGISYSIEISRKKSKKGILKGIFLATFTVCFYLFGKSIKSNAYLSILLSLCSFSIVFFLCTRRLKRISRGLE